MSRAEFRNTEFMDCVVLCSDLKQWLGLCPWEILSVCGMDLIMRQWGMVESFPKLHSHRALSALHTAQKTYWTEIRLVIIKIQTKVQNTLTWTQSGFLAKPGFLDIKLRWCKAFQWYEKCRCDFGHRTVYITEAYWMFLGQWNKPQWCTKDNHYLAGHTHVLKSV